MHRKTPVPGVLLWILWNFEKHLLNGTNSVAFSVSSLFYQNLCCSMQHSPADKTKHLKFESIFIV